MTFSWKELVLHGLLKKVGEPSLVKDLMKLVMKERFSFLEEEARVFHSENVVPVIEVYCFHSRCPPWERRTIIQEFERIRYSPSPILSPKTWRTAIRYKNLKKELMHINGLLETEHHDPQSPWVAYADETSDTHYYHNTVNGETSWMVPPEGVAWFAGGDDGGEYSEENYDY